MVKTLVTTLIVIIWSLNLVAQANQNFDKYGGSKTFSGKATGFFHLEKINDRLWLITPDGNVFFTLGLNHINVYKKPVYKQIEVFQKEESAERKILDDLKGWNMNTFGSDYPEFLIRKMPFIQNASFLSNGHYKSVGDFHFDDVFSSEFVGQTKNKIVSICKRFKSNPYLIGYYFTDTPRWDIDISRKRHGNDWVSYIKDLKADSEGKQRYVAFLRKKYKVIERFNAAYGLFFLSFEQLLNARFDHFDSTRKQIVEDDHAFLEIIAEQLYSLIAKTFREQDPNHLLLGDKYIAGDHPEGVLKIAAKYVDAISIQPGPEKGPGAGPGLEERQFNQVQFDKIHALTGLSILICDHQTSFYTETYPVTLWNQCKSQEASGKIYQKYLSDCISSTYIIGYHRCQYISYYDKQRGLLKQGLLDTEGNHYEVISDYTSKVNKSVLETLYKMTF